MSDLNIVPFNEQTLYKTGYTAPVSLPTDYFQMDVILEGPSAVSANLALQVTDNPNDESSWVDSGVEITLAGQRFVRGSDFGFSTRRFFRINVKSFTGTSITVMTRESSSGAFPTRVALLSDTTSATKSKVFTLPSLKPIALDVVISGTATVRLYASNVESSPTGTRWGTHLREFTISEKIIIENEPWIYWMVEHVSGAGTVNVSMGA